VVIEEVADGEKEAIDLGVGVARSASKGTEELACGDENEKSLGKFIIEKRRAPDLVLGVGEVAWSRASSCAVAAHRDEGREICEGGRERVSVGGEIGSSKEVFEFRALREGAGDVNSWERMSDPRRDTAGVRGREWVSCGECSVL
jgi:hypothetical protein